MAYILASLLLLASNCSSLPTRNPNAMEDLIQGSLEADALKKRGEALVATGGLSNYNSPGQSATKSQSATQLTIPVRSSGH